MNNLQSQLCPKIRMNGFTLLELLVATSMFLVIAGATFSLFRTHAPYFNSQQNLAGLNIAMQNAVTQMQLDLSNAGTGFYANTNIPSWPVGVVITNQLPTTPCNIPATYTYTATCFDTLNVLTMNPNIAPAHPTDAAGDANGCSNAAATTFYILPYAPVGSETVAQAATRTASSFSAGDQVILITGGNGAKVNTFVLTSNAVAGSNYVALSHLASDPTYFTNTSANDPLGFTAVSGQAQTPPYPSKLGNAFCSPDWVMKLQPTTYSVDISNPQDPKLDRIHAGSTDIIAEQVIGFKVGVTSWNDAAATSSETYHFNPADYYYDFTLVRSVRVSLIGRTTLTPDPTYTFRNAFDQGPYQVVGATVVVNPRNMSMND